MPLPPTESLYQMVLSSIESQCDDEFCEELSMQAFSDKQMDPLLRECIERLTNIYTIAHAFNKSHSCYRAHDAWRKPVLSSLQPGEDSTVVESPQMEITNEC